MRIPSAVVILYQLLFMVSITLLLYLPGAGLYRMEYWLVMLYWIWLYSSIVDIYGVMLDIYFGHWIGMPAVHPS